MPNDNIRYYARLEIFEPIKQVFEYADAYGMPYDNGAVSTSVQIFNKETNEIMRAYHNIPNTYLFKLSNDYRLLGE